MTAFHAVAATQVLFVLQLYTCPICMLTRIIEQTCDLNLRSFPSNPFAHNVQRHLTSQQAEEESFT